jgi:WD40 repeat protein
MVSYLEVANLPTTMNSTHVVVLDRTLQHHNKSINALAVSPDTHSLLSGGTYVFYDQVLSTFKWLLDDDAQVVVWNLQTGEKKQVIRCTFNGPIGAITWITSGDVEDDLAFAFGCADGSIHFYKRKDKQVRCIRLSTHSTNNFD